MTKDQERLTYAWMYGAQAHKEGKERVVPQVWDKFADVWLKGFDGEPLAGGKHKRLSGQVEAEVYEAAVME